MKENYFGVIMAGGVGSRFWPMSKANHPKQFMDILGTGRSLLQQTYDRLSAICPADNIYVATNVLYRDLTLQQLPSLTADKILCEPERRNTAPCIAYAYKKIAAKNENAIMLVAPSDHLIINEVVFTQIMKESFEFAATNDALVTIGITPSRPDTGYGYIHFERGKTGFSKVLSFKEKPDLENAVAFIKSGDYSWNSGMFIWHVNSIDNAFKKYLPEIHQLFSAGNEYFNSTKEQGFVNEIYGKCQNISIDFGIMEKAQNVSVVNADLGWSDLGSWGSLYGHLPQDKFGNAIIARHSLISDSSGNIVHVPEDKLLVLRGLNDYIVVDHENALLICKKEEEQYIKEIVETLSKQSGHTFT